MAWSWEELYADVGAARDKQELVQVVALWAKRLGFEYRCEGLHVPVLRAGIAARETSADGWVVHYCHNGFLAVDAAVQLDRRSTGLIVCSETIFASGTCLLAGVHGRDFSLTQPCWEAHGAYCLVALSRYASRLRQREVAYLLTQANWLSSLGQNLMAQFVKPKLAPEAHVSLTPREREVLRWTGEGKTACEVGRILSISERTVNFHVSNVLHKLAATNKVQAVAKAAAMGLFD